MPYLYDMQEGSLADLERRVSALLANPPATAEYAVLFDDDEMDAESAIAEWSPAERALQLAVYQGDWRQTGFAFSNFFDWHECEKVYEQADAISGELTSLLSMLFETPPLGISPSDWGYVGSLSAASVAKAIELAEPVVGAEADLIRADRKRWSAGIDDHPLGGPARALVSLRSVTPGLDVIVSLG